MVISSPLLIRLRQVSDRLIADSGCAHVKGLFASPASVITAKRGCSRPNRESLQTGVDAYSPVRTMTESLGRLAIP